MSLDASKELITMGTALLTGDNECETAAILLRQCHVDADVLCKITDDDYEELCRAV